MRQVSEYREHAMECRRLASQMQVEDHRDQLLSMAETWDRMAEERERLLTLKEERSFSASAPE